MSAFTSTQGFLLLIALIVLVGYALHLAFRDEEEVKKARKVERWMTEPDTDCPDVRLTGGHSAQTSRPANAIPPTESGVPPKPGDR